MLNRIKAALGRIRELRLAGLLLSRRGSGPETRIDTDVVAAAEQLRRRGADRIVLIGSSMGATAVLVAATRIRPPVAGVVSLSGPAAFGAVNAWTAMRRLPRGGASSRPP